MNPILMSALLLSGLGAFTFFILRSVRLLFFLQWENRFDQIPLRIKTLLTKGFGQQGLMKKKKERSAGIMHAFIFWGFLVLAIRTLTLVGVGYQESFHFPFLGPDYLTGYLYIFLKDVFEGIVLFMVCFAMYRRFFLKPARLTDNVEAWFILWMIFILMFSDLLYDGARINLVAMGNPDQIHWFSHAIYGDETRWAPVANLVAWFLQGEGYWINMLVLHFSFWIHIFVVLLFLCFLPNGKHFHVITALPNVFLGSFGYPHTPVPLLDCEDEDAWENESLGVNRIDQFTWKQGLDLYTCTECGRCLDVCPTHVTNKPLSLKNFNIDLRKHLEESEGFLGEKRSLLKKIAAEKEEKAKEAIQQELEDLKGKQKSLVGDVISEDTLWACTTCRACEEVCPVSIEHVPRILEMRQGQTLIAEAQPAEMNTAYKGIERNYNPWGVGFDKREDWTQGLDVKVMKKDSDVEYLFWVGCAGAFDDRSQKTARAMAQLLKRAGVSFAILGKEEKCTGDSARRSGNEMLYQMMATDNIETLNNYKVKKIVTICPHCLNTLGNEYPQLGGNYEVIHHTQMIAQLIEEGRLKPDKTLEGALTYHDPCYLGRYNNVYEQPRTLLNKVSQEGITEMERHGNQSFCCGAGGARMWMEETIGTRINEERTREALETNPKTIATGCPFCQTMLNDGLKAAEKEDVALKDISELVLEALPPEKSILSD